ncbi:MAG: site-specific DNA-methyltransferase [Phycisphaerales bacterium]|nr:site-specific DNA-methyltransferase [Phycisphaerales bacterium]
MPNESVDLVYVDPPFNTGKSQQGAAAKYEDAWPTMEAYIRWIRPRVEQVHRVLKPTGSLLLHCDWRGSHHLRLLLDDVFGPDRFVNELIWSYGLGGSSPRRFARKHDTILFYSRTDVYFFQPPMVPATSARMRGQLKKAGDILDIPSLNNMAAERTGYPTQKPLALLEMLISACCPEGGRVADFCCGSGTTLIAAKRLGRPFVGCDVSDDAVRMTEERLGSV